MYDDDDDGEKLSSLPNPHPILSPQSPHLSFFFSTSFSQEEKKRRGERKRGGKKEGGKEGGCEWMDGVIYIYMDGWVGGGLVSGMLSVGARESVCVCVSVCTYLYVCRLFVCLFVFFSGLMGVVVASYLL